MTGRKQPIARPLPWHDVDKPTKSLLPWLDVNKPTKRPLAYLFMLFKNYLIHETLILRTYVIVWRTQMIIICIHLVPIHSLLKHWQFGWSHMWSVFRGLMKKHHWKSSAELVVLLDAFRWDTDRFRCHNSGPCSPYHRCTFHPDSSDRSRVQHAYILCARPSANTQTVLTSEV